MKWFKHMADAHDDEKLAMLRDEGGFEAYGFYWFMLEVIAKQMDKTDKCYVEYPIKHWQRITGFYPKKLQRLLNVLQMFGLCLVNVQPNFIKVECPNLLKIRDNHSKNLQATCKQEVDIEVDKDNDNNTRARNLLEQIDEILSPAIVVNTSRLSVWMEQGVSDHLILETIKRVKAKSRYPDQITTLNYFDKAMASAIEDRNTPMERPLESMSFKERSELKLQKALERHGYGPSTDTTNTH